MRIIKKDGENLVVLDVLENSIILSEYFDFDGHPYVDLMIKEIVINLTEEEKKKLGEYLCG